MMSGVRIRARCSSEARSAEIFSRFSLQLSTYINIKVMSKRTIVAMRGQPRTYNWLKDHTRDILDRAYGDYDFYWISRPSTTVSHDQIIEDWQGHRPQVISAGEYQHEHNNSQRAQSYLDWELGQHIDWSQVEQMVLIRPDVYYVPAREGSSIPNIAPMTITGWWIEDRVKESVSDFYCQAGAQAAQLLLRRHQAEWRELSEWMVQQQFDTVLSPDQTRGNWASWACRLVRPTQIPFNAPQWNAVSNYDPEWDRLTRREKRALCDKLSIDPKDYSVEEKFYKKKFPQYEYNSVESFGDRSIYSLKNCVKT